MRFAKRLTGAAMAVVAAGCGGDGAGDGGIGPTGPLFLGNTVSVTVTCQTLQVGQSGFCNASGYDSNNAFTSSNSSSWSSSNTSVATVTGGVLTAVGPGTTTISAVVEGITGSTSVTILAPLAASINGPGSVRPNTTCYWWATASGGTPPYSYSWSGGSNGSASGADYLADSPGSGTFTVTVTVTDANGGTKFVSKTVAVSSSASICPV